MKKINLNDQPLQSPAGADPANGQSEPLLAMKPSSASMFSQFAGGIVQKSVETIQSIASTQYGMVAGIAKQVASIVQQPSRTPQETYKRPTDNQQGHRSSETKTTEYRPWDFHEKKPRDGILNASIVRSPAGRKRSETSVSMGSPDTDAKSAEMSKTSGKIVDHEMKHASILREGSGDISQAKPIYSQKQGPDGKRHAVSGEVNVDLDPASGSAEDTEKKATLVTSSAMSDIKRSRSDNEAGRRAAMIAQAARAEKRGENSGFKNPDMSTGQVQSQQIQSPHSVRMGFPAMIARGVMTAGRVVGRGVVRAGRATGRGIARVGRATRRGAAGAWNATRNAVSSIQPMALLRNTTNIITSLTSMVTSVKGVTSSLDDMSTKLKNFSPEITVQKARNEINALNQSMGQARRLGPGLAEWEKNKGRINLAGNDMMEGLLKMILPVVNTIASVVASILEWTVSIGEYIKTMIVDLITIIDNYVSRAIPGFQVLKDILSHITLFRPPQEKVEDDVLMKNLSDLFMMPIPGPNAVPQLAGPKKSLQIPKFKPQPIMFPGI
jgi:hypothetical protein